MIKRYLNKKILGVFLGLALVGVICCINIFIGVFLLLIGGANALVFYVYRSKVPNIFRASKRDYEELIIGSKNVYKRTEEELMCVSFNRSLQMNRLILERMYSFIKRGGKVTFHINLCKDRIKGINPSDIYYLHGVTLNELGVKFSRIRYFFPLVVNPVYAINYLIWSISNDGIRRKREKQISDIVNWILGVKSFCKERELQAVFQLYGKKEDIVQVRERIGIEVLRGHEAEE